MNFMKYTPLWFLISGLLILPGLIALGTWGLRVGIDFKGGTLLEVQFTDPTQADVTQIRESLGELTLDTLVIQSTGEGRLIVRTNLIDEEQHQTLVEKLTTVGEHQELRFETVGPTVSRDLTNKAILAVIVASIVIILFIAFAFRSVPKPASSWLFGLAAIAALLHDLIFVIGAFAILGHFFHYEVDSLFITALLTIMGFSVHDTIVVFDRIRENLKRVGDSGHFEAIANFSLGQTLARSLSTSMTVILVLLALFLLGGETIRGFVLALLLGITIGTYSSIFNATPLVVVWHRLRQRRA